MKRVIRYLRYTALLVLCDIKIAGLYAFLFSAAFVVFILTSIEGLAIKAVCTVCGIEPRMPLSYKLAIKLVKYIGKLGGRYADEPSETLGGQTYNEWVDDAEENLKNGFTRL